LDHRVATGTGPAIGPAVEAAFLNPGQIVGHQIVAQPVALVDHGPQVTGRRMESHPYRVAQSGREALACIPRAVEAADGGPGFGLHPDIAARTDGDPEAVGLRIELKAAGPVAAGA